MRRGMSRPQRQGNVGAGRRAATPTPRRPIHKTRRHCPAWQPPLLIANSLRRLHLICMEIISWALNRATPPSFSLLCPALPIQLGGAAISALSPLPCLTTLPTPPPPSSWRGAGEGCWQSTHLVGSPACALGEPALHQWVQGRGGTRQVICPPAWPCPGKGGGGWRAAAVAGCTCQEYGW